MSETNVFSQQSNTKWTEEGTHMSPERDLNLDYHMHSPVDHILKDIDQPFLSGFEECKSDSYKQTPLERHFRDRTKSDVIVKIYLFIHLADQLSLGFCPSTVFHDMI